MSLSAPGATFRVDRRFRLEHLPLLNRFVQSDLVQLDPHSSVVLYTLPKYHVMHRGECVSSCEVHRRREVLSGYRLQTYYDLLMPFSCVKWK